MFESSTFNAQTLTITPEIAEQLLGQNRHNRKISNSNFAAVKNALTRGEWKLNGEAIKIAQNGAVTPGADKQIRNLMSTQIVTQIDGELRVSSEMIAERTDTQHKNVLELIRANTPALEAFGRVAFETRPLETAGGVQARQVAQLNEPQSTLLMTLMRNSEIVIVFKLELVKQFYAMKQALMAPTLPASYADALRELAATVEQTAALEAKVQEDAPKVAQAEAYAAGAGLTNRASFSRELIAWATGEGYQVKQAEVFAFLGRAGLFIRGERSDHGEASLDAIRRGLAVTEKGVTRTGKNFATGKLTPAGKGYAWDRCVRHLARFGTLDAAAVAA